jgi:hypothetical protein
MLFQCCLEKRGAYHSSVHLTWAWGLALFVGCVSLISAKYHLFILLYKLALRVRTYPQILSKYLSVRSSVACVPLQIILGTVFRLIICSVVCENA